ncbi:MAG: DUF3883 domain-containing protein [Deltaproteobacteria bacterium]|nr:DUF3883 domain-containing protein [Deltaproteobacteria bacterium]
MAGLYIREMLARRLLKRVLIIPPAGLVGNWKRELQILFNLPFRIAQGSDARIANPFTGPDSHLLIVSLDTLAGERMFSRLQDPETAPYDLVIVDEAHKLSASQDPDLTVRKTDRYRLAEALVGLRGDESRWRLNWTCQHLLLLTATPHMGKDFPYFSLWKLLEPGIFSTLDAFKAFPNKRRQTHFIRRTKEEMVHYNGRPLYPTRVSDTLSYELSQGEAGEQRLYDETTNYLQAHYNRALILNRSAARLAMSIFQRRLASSTYALLKSLERRAEKLAGLIEDIQSGRLNLERLVSCQQQLVIRDVLDEMTADEEGAADGQEENEVAEDRALEGVVAQSLADLEAEYGQVQELLNLARVVYNSGDESKFEKLREVVRDPRYSDEKIIIFTEHRDTLDFLVRRFESLGFTGLVAQIHGGMDYRERDEQVEFFRKPVGQGGARLLVATDAAGEGINLQFCWLMVNYDIPWNPARLEQRMGRIHRYGQRHDPVVIINLVASKTREGRVLKILLDKLELIRKELGSDKVFDVIGRLFHIEGLLTKEQVQALEDRERALYGDGGHVRSQLPRLKENLHQETFRRLLPGYVLRFLEKAADLLDLGLEGDLTGIFSLVPLKPGAMEPLWPVLESYPTEQRQRFTVYRPQAQDAAIFLHPGEPVFELLCDLLRQRYGRQALQGCVFRDPLASEPYLFHLATVEIERLPDPYLPLLSQTEVLEYGLVGIRQDETGFMQECPVEHLLLLKSGDGFPFSLTRFAKAADELRRLAQTYIIENLAQPWANARRQALLDSLGEREDFLRRGYDYRNAELAAMRVRLTEKAKSGDPWAKGELSRIKERQQALWAQREKALATLRQEPELISPGKVTFLAHALVGPASDPEDQKRYDKAIEAAAVRVAWAYEESCGASVKDVSTPERARAAGLSERPGFDLLSRHTEGEERAIEVKGRARIGDIEVSENEWARACNLREGYWLYVVYDCATPCPRLLRVRDPFGKLLVKAKGGVVIEEQGIFAAAVGEEAP